MRQLLTLALLLCLPAWAQNAPAAPPAPAKSKAEQKPGAAKRPEPPPAPTDESPSAAGESSSRSSIIDLSPPPADRNREPDPYSDVSELQKWDPHRAAKNVEVGDYYFKRGNYPAALSRYQEALEWKSNDAIATFRLAETEEKLGQPDQARRYYQQYLQILPRGPLADDARHALARLGSPPAGAPPPANPKPR